VTRGSDRQGVFELPDFPPGKVPVSFSKVGYAGGSALIPPEAGEVELTVTSQSQPAQ
jgi:hypothetical protein